MSGLEALGLVLAIIPLFVTAVEKYERGYSIVAEWIEFRTDYHDFCDKLRNQQIILRQLAEITLRSVTESEDDVQSMLKNPKCEKWKDPLITEKLKLQLSGEGEYVTYISGIQTVYERLSELEKLLNVDNLPGLKSADLENDSHQISEVPERRNLVLKNELKIVRLFFRRKRLAKRMKKIICQIETIDRIIRTASTLEPRRPSQSGNAIAQIFERARQQATSLHHAITNAWTCDCRRSHFFKLLLSKSDRKGVKTPHASNVSDEVGLKVALPFGSAAGLQQVAAKILDGEHVGNWCTAQTSMTSEPEGFLLTLNHFSTLRIEENHSNRRRSVSSGSSDRTVSSYDSAPTHHKSATTTGDARFINDLCYILKYQAKTESYLGVLYDEPGNYHSLTVLSGTYSAKTVSRVVSLGQILNRDSQVPDSVNLSLPRSDRLSVALIIASSLLELFSSPWLPDNWDKNNIYFFVDSDGRVMLKDPFLLSESSAKAQQSVNPERSNALLSLGTLILELWFDQPLEAQACWRDNFGPNGKETPCTKLSAAATWQEKIKMDAGLALHGITWRCIWSDFGLGTQNLRNKELIKAVHEDVVKELEKVLDMFE